MQKPCAQINPDEALMWECHRLRLHWQGHSVALALGMRTGGTVHWWENCSLDVLEQTPFCTVVEIGGAIAHKKETRAHRAGTSFFDNPLLHRHNWLNTSAEKARNRNTPCPNGSRACPKGLSPADTRLRAKPATICVLICGRF